MGEAVVGIAVVTLVVGGLWFFGRTQPVEVVERTVVNAGAATICPTCRGTKQVTCSLCGGEGRVAGGEQSCPGCNGTGKGKWQLNGASRARRLGADPVCTQCKGTGRLGSRQDCAMCSGARTVSCPDCAGFGTQEDSTRRTVRTVRAGYSLWERILSWVFLSPDDDCAPQALSGGRVPLVEAYLPLFERAGLTMRVIRWGGVSRGDKGWEVRTLLKLRRGETETEEGRVFVVHNREVTDTRPFAWR
jgi:hypothetical protein